MSNGILASFDDALQVKSIYVLAKRRWRKKNILDSSKAIHFLLLHLHQIYVKSSKFYIHTRSNEDQNVN